MANLPQAIAVADVVHVRLIIVIIAAAIKFCHLRGVFMEKIQSLLQNPVAVINVGLELFYQDLQARKIPSIHLDWQPSHIMNPKIQNILKKIRS